MCSLLFIEFNAHLVFDVFLLSTSTTLEYLLQGLRVAENIGNSLVWLTSAPYFIFIYFFLVESISIVNTGFLKIKYTF